MAHAVTQVLDAVVTAVSGLALTGSRVYSERPTAHALEATEIPAIRVYDQSETASNSGYNNGFDVYQRTINFTVEAVVKASLANSPSDTSREIASAIESALSGHLLIGGKQVRLWYQGAEVIDSAEGEQLVVVRRMRFSAEIITAANAPDTLL